jgi:hypothetical protein
MPKIYQPNSPPPVRPPVCPGCQKPMRFAFVERDERHLNLRHAIFQCACGRISDQVIADTNEAA